MLQKVYLLVIQQLNPNLFGVRIPGELGNKNDLIESLQVFQVQYIDAGNT